MILPEQNSQMKQEAYLEALHQAADTKLKQDFIKNRITLNDYLEAELDFIHNKAA